MTHRSAGGTRDNAWPINARNTNYFFWGVALVTAALILLHELDFPTYFSDRSEWYAQHALKEFSFDKDKVLVLTEESLFIDPNNRKAIILRALTFNRNGEAEKAKQALSTLIEKERPLYAKDTLAALIAIHLGECDLEGARELSGEGMKRFPEYFRYYAYASFILIKEKEFDAAKEVLNRGMQASRLDVFPYSDFPAPLGFTWDVLPSAYIFLPHSGKEMDGKIVMNDQAYRMLNLFVGCRDS